MLSLARQRVSAVGLSRWRFRDRTSSTTTSNTDGASARRHRPDHRKACPRPAAAGSGDCLSDGHRLGDIGRSPARGRGRRAPVPFRATRRPSARPTTPQAFLLEDYLTPSTRPAPAARISALGLIGLLALGLAAVARPGGRTTATPYSPSTTNTTPAAASASTSTTTPGPAISGAGAASTPPGQQRPTAARTGGCRHRRQCGHIGYGAATLARSSRRHAGRSEHHQFHHGPSSFTEPLRGHLRRDLSSSLCPADRSGRRWNAGRPGGRELRRHPVVTTTAGPSTTPAPPRPRADGHPRCRPHAELRSRQRHGQRHRLARRRIPALQCPPATILPSERDECQGHHLRGVLEHI